MANGNNVRDQLGVSATTGVTDNPVITILNRLLGAVWRACAQHQSHIALIEAWGLHALADAMRIRTADEPVTIRALLNRLVDLDGTPAFTIEAPAIGVTVREILDNDMGLQRHTRPTLNAAAEAAGSRSRCHYPQSHRADPRRRRGGSQLARNRNRSLREAGRVSILREPPSGREGGRFITRGSLPGTCKVLYR